MPRRIVRRGVLLLTAAGWIAWSTTSSGQAQNTSRPAGAAVSSSMPAASAAPRAVLDQYCVGCHNAKLRTGDLSLDSIDPTQAAAHPEVWEKVIRKLRTGSMPPAGRRR